VNGGTLVNVNDFEVRVSIEQSLNSGSTWFPYTVISILANGHQTMGLGVGGILRARCSNTDSGDSVSAWSYGYTYPNPENIQPPIVNGGTIVNVNDFEVWVSIEQSTNSGSTWSPYIVISIPANGNQTIGVGVGGILRARCASTGTGDSVSAWSYNYTYPNPENLQPPIVSGSMIANNNDFAVFASVEQSVNSGSTWLPHTVFEIAANSFMNTGNGNLLRARFASTGAGDSVSAWTYGSVPGAFYFKLNPNRTPPLSTMWPFNGEVDDGFGGQVFYLDQAFTIPATTPPTALDTVVMSGTGIVNMFQANNSAGWAGTLIVRGNVELMAIAGSISVASATFYDNSSISVGFVASGAITFNDNSTSGASHEAQLITLNDHASSGGFLIANVIMNDHSQCFGYIRGNLTLNDHAAYCASDPTGTFIDNSDGVCP
jgi:hypothetical protein